MSKVRISPSGACPTFFRALCRTASQGETGGWAEAGCKLVSSVAGLAPHDIEDEQWLDRVEHLQTAILDCEDEAVLAWLEANLPRCMALVPTDDRPEFLEGIYRAVLEDEVDILDP